MPQPTSLRTTVRKFAVGQKVVLFQIDLTKFGGTVLYYTNEIFEERIPIQFGGNTYLHLACRMTDIVVDSQSAPAQPKFAVATAGGPVNALIQQYSDLRGAVVRRITTFTEFLDQRPNGSGGVEANPSADANAVVSEELYVVDRKMAANERFAEFQLKAPTDQDNVQLPKQIVRKRWCQNQYRVFDDALPGDFAYVPPVDGGCPWGNVDPDGGDYYDEFDQPTTKANDRCSKQMTGCLVRYGQTAALPFGGFPGVRAPQET